MMLKFFSVIITCVTFVYSTYSPIYTAEHYFHELSEKRNNHSDEVPTFSKLENSPVQDTCPHGNFSGKEEKRRKKKKKERIDG